MNRREFEIGIIILIITTHLGCASWLKEQQLQKVAKDWSMTIRASQVIPVYPLTEDLQPGDVFLVNTPVQEQAKQYKGRGFLPLDQHIVRLHNLNYSEFYQGSFGIGNFNPPQHWQFPADGTTVWKQAPLVSFPSYTFTVSTGQGFKMALPIQGVPVGLNLMNSSNATGSVTLKNGYVYGVSLEELKGKIIEWSKKDENKILLENFRKDNPNTILYLRIVSRVYLVKSVQISLTDDSAFAGSLSAGQSQDVKLLDLKNKDVVANYVSSVNTLITAYNDSLKNLPGGALKVVNATGRTIILKENFTRPLVIGYLGFDFPILEHGILGVPVATQKNLTSKKEPSPKLGEFSDESILLESMLTLINSEPEDKQKEIYGMAAKRLGDEFNEKYQARLKNQKPRIAFSNTRAEFELTNEDLVAPYKVYKILKNEYERR